jgi:Flp pilus assembly protein TadD
MASALDQEKRWQEALPYARECVRLRPSNPEYGLLLANVLARGGQHDEAEAEFFRAESLRQNPRKRYRISRRNQSRSSPKFLG